MGKIANIYFRTLDKTTLPFLHILRTLRHPNIKIWIDGSIATQPALLRIKDKKIVEHLSIDNDIFYCEWDLHSWEIKPANDGMKHIVSRYCTDKTEFIIVDNLAYPKNRITLFRDVLHKEELPDGFYKFPCFNTIDNLLNYCEETGIFPFSLKDKKRFQTASSIDPIQGAIVYKEISTGNYWYKDMLHKNHYEVFDKTGKKHLGEADINGVLNTSDKDDTKTISVK